MATYNLKYLGKNNATVSPESKQEMMWITSDHHNINWVLLKYEFGVFKSHVFKSQEQTYLESHTLKHTNILRATHGAN